MNDDDDTRDIRARIDDRVRAVRAKDIDALLAQYAPDVVTFDLVTPLVNRGLAAVRARVGDWSRAYAAAPGRVTPSTCGSARPSAIASATDAGSSCTSTARCRST